MIIEKRWGKIPSFLTRRNYLMARARKDEVNNSKSVLDLGQSMGLTTLTDSTVAKVDDWIPTLFPTFDYIIGGGIPMGRVTEVFGLEQSGKSTFAVHVMKMAIAVDVPVVMIDVEGTAAIDNLVGLGVDPGKVFIIQPSEDEDGGVLTIEAVTDKVEEILQVFGDAGKKVLIIWDSLASTATKQEMKADFNPNQMGR